MFRLHKHRAEKSGDKIEFRISHLKALQGSSRSGILGEATVSLTSYMSSGAAIPLSIPLNKCNHGTVLHVTVQCLTPRTKLRDQESSETKFHLKAINESNYDLSVKSNESDCSNVQSVESSSVEDFDSILSPGEIETMATSFSGSVSNCSHNSTEGSTGRGNISPSISDGQSPTARQDSTSSQKSVSHHNYPVNDTSQPNNSSFNSQNMQHIGALSSKKTNASNNRLEAAGDTSEELRAEAKMWEMNARKLMGDLDMLRTEFSDQSKKLAGIEMDLSATQVERDGLKKEVEQLKLSFEDPVVRQKALEDSVSQVEGIPEIENALKEELKFEKESNANLSLQLKKSQEANIELLRDLTNEQEFRLSELENSRSQAARLQEKIMEMQSEIDSSTEDLKQKLMVAKIHWSEAQEECEYLRGANQKLQITIEDLAEECSSFEKLNGDLKQQNLKLEGYCSHMEARLRESDERFSKCSEGVELLEKKFDLKLEDIASKEKHLTSDLDGFFYENRKHMEQAQVLLNQMQMEMMVETQNLELEVEKLSLKLSAAHDEKERIASNAMLEVSTLRADKAKLESAFEEAQSKVSLAKKEVDMIQSQYEQKLEDLTTQLAEYKIKMEMLMTEHEKLLKLVEDYKSRELKFKSTINALELKLTVTEYERQQVMDESGILKVQLQQTHQFENEIIALKNELDASNSEKERLEASLCLTSELCEDLKAEKISSGLKILALEQAASELEDCKKTRASLEEKLLQLENDLKAKETRCVQDTELSHSKRINRQHQQTIQLLEQEKAEFQTKAQVLEEELKLIKEQKRNQVSKLNRKSLPVHDDLKASKNPVVKNTIQYRSNRRKSLKNDREVMKDQQDPGYSIKHQSEVETELGLLDENVHAVEVDPLPKTQLVENELAKEKEVKNIYEVQFDRSPSQDRNNQANGPVKPMAEELVTKEKFERTKSMLEAELRDIQERYFHMSLKYAEVEAEREELVMKLKATRKKGWLS
uniref:C2 NT-type domain-containing protein n=1 Tax=Glycine max TaxID=3847 RepID=A0A0R0I123_SOYBN